MYMYSSSSQKMENVTPQVQIGPRIISLGRHLWLLFLIHASTELLVTGLVLIIVMESAVGCHAYNYMQL